MSTPSLPPIPSQEAFVAALSASIKQQQEESTATDNLNIVKVTVFEKTDRRGSAYVDCSSPEAAQQIVDICRKFPPQFSDESNVDISFKNRCPLVVSIKPSNNNNNAASSSSTLLVTYTHAAPKLLIADEETNTATTATSTINNNKNISINVNTAGMTIAPPLYVRCKKFFKIHHIFDFFRANNIAGHAVDCVFCSSSKKPYFLVEWGKNVDSFKACLYLDGMSFNGDDVSIKISTQSAAEYREKKPESLSLAAKRETKIRQRQDEDAEYLKTSGGFMPISVLMNQAGSSKPPPNKAGNDDDDDADQK